MHGFGNWELIAKHDNLHLQDKTGRNPLKVAPSSDTGTTEKGNPRKELTGSSSYWEVVRSVATMTARVSEIDQERGINVC